MMGERQGFTEGEGLGSTRWGKLEEETFSLSEAVSYCEYTLDVAMRAQRGE